MFAVGAWVLTTISSEGALWQIYHRLTYFTVQCQIDPQARQPCSLIGQLLGKNVDKLWEERVASPVDLLYRLIWHALVEWPCT
jgi:hypothetical protein